MNNDKELLVCFPQRLVLASDTQCTVRRLMMMMMMILFLTLFLVVWRIDGKRQ